MKLFKNFLRDEDFNILKQNLTSSYFPWYFHKGVLYENDGNVMMTHNFFDNQKNYINSNYFDLLKNLITNINPFTLIRIKANLTFPTKKNKETGLHIDIQNAKNYKIFTGLYYLNTNDGYTLFEDGTKNYSIENSYIEFDGSIKHQAVTHTNTSNRIVINFNYIK